MEYKYNFNSESITIDVDEEWLEILREYDRLERNDNIAETKKNYHYHDLDFEPEFLGAEDKGFSFVNGEVEPSIDDDISVMFDGSPAFNYALSFLTPRHQEVLYRRAIQGETFNSIAKSYGCSHGSVAHSYYKRLCARFRKRFEEFQWLNSKENTAPLGAGKIEVITKGLTPAQIMAIRAYRCQYKNLHEISRLVDVPYYRVQECLHDNPILETACPICGKPVQQKGHERMTIFCSHRCYLAWHRDNQLLPDSYVNEARPKERINENQKIVIDFYRQLYIPVPIIGKLVGVPRLTVSSYVKTFPLPYTFCQYCGVKIPAGESRKLLKYCSKKCRVGHDNREYRLNKEKQLSPTPERVIPTFEQLEYAVILRRVNYDFIQIECLTGLTSDEIDMLFRFHSPEQKECPVCKAKFVSQDERKIYCSKECCKAVRHQRKK